MNVWPKYNQCTVEESLAGLTKVTQSSQAQCKCFGAVSCCTSPVSNTGVIFKFSHLLLQACSKTFIEKQRELILLQVEEAKALLRMSDLRAAACRDDLASINKELKESNRHLLTMEAEIIRQVCMECHHVFHASEMELV